MDLILGLVIATLVWAFFPEPLTKVKAWVLSLFKKNPVA